MSAKIISVGKTIFITFLVLFISVSFTAYAEVNNPPTLVPIGSYETTEEFRDMEIVGDYAYLVGEDLYVIDISDPTDPNVVGQSDTPYRYSNLAVSDTIALLTAASGYYPNVDYSLNIINIADPGAPYLINTIPIDMTYYRWDIAVKGDYVYLLYGDDISIFDVSDPANPVAEGVFPDYPGYAYYIKVIGDRAYVGGLFIYDVSNPQTPVLEGSNYLGAATSVAVDDTVVYMSGLVYEIYFGWLSAVSISDITNPHNIGYIDFGGSYDEAWDVAVSNDYAYVLKWAGLEIVNISDPANLIDVGDFAPPHSPRKIEIRDNYLYLACDGGFYIYQIQPAEFICGDVNYTGIVDILDITYLLNYLYNDGPAPNPPSSGDVNGSGGINLLDITYMIRFLYQGGPVPNCE